MHYGKAFGKKFTAPHFHNQWVGVSIMQKLAPSVGISF
jgi:hypothetical protein